MLIITTEQKLFAAVSCDFYMHINTCQSKSRANSPEPNPITEVDSLTGRPVQQTDGKTVCPGTALSVRLPTPVSTYLLHLECSQGSTEVQIDVW